ncbi:MAG: CDP-glycerol glycerophosphotransferase family protein [Nitrospiraceae bacterium]
MMIPLVCSLVLTIFCQPAFGYLDPGTGSMLTSALLGLLATLLFVLKGLYYKGLRWVLGYFGSKGNDATLRHELVFYSEGRQYWSTFKPVIDELVSRRVKCRYLTSDDKDPGLVYPSELAESKYIGTGNKAYTYLRFLEADVCVMTTPGLDVLQIKRSRGVKHYAHLMHAPTDAAMYKTYSFDYYDSILTSGNHQIRSIRKLEELRGASRKVLLKTGCLYYDEMKRRLKELVPPPGSTKHKTVLVAPTWGANGLLMKFGMRLLVPLLEMQYNVILRPHPQSFISESEMLGRLRDEIGHYSNLEWDNESDGMRSMSRADVMVSDLSGVVFDFALLFEKPVLTLKYDLNRLGLEAADLPWDPWELTVLDSIGKRVDEKELDNLPQIIEGEIERNDRKETIQHLRDGSVYNFGCAAEHVVNGLLHISDEIHSQAGNSKSKRQQSLSEDVFGSDYQNADKLVKRLSGFHRTFKNSP